MNGFSSLAGAGGGGSGAGAGAGAGGGAGAAFALAAAPAPRKRLRRRKSATPPASSAPIARNAERAFDDRDALSSALNTSIFHETRAKKCGNKVNS